MPNFDFYCPLMSLPLAFRTTLRNIPAKVPYLFVSERGLQGWHGTPGERRGVRIGIAWSGNPNPDPARSIPLEKLSPILFGKVEWHSLQKDIRDEDRECLIPKARVFAHNERIVDFCKDSRSHIGNGYGDFD